MSIDDTSDKLRRNLVVFSSIYLAAVFLGVDIREVLPITEKLRSVSPYRLHVLSMFVFIYIAFRWFTSATQKDEWKTFYHAWAVSVSKGLKRRFSKFIESKHLKADGGIEIAGSAKNELMLDVQAAEELHYWHMQLANEFQHPEEENIFVNAVTPRGFMNSGVVELGIVVIFFEDTGRSSSTVINYQIKPWQMFKYHFRAASAVMSHASFWEWFIPILLALPTFIVIAHRLAFL